MTAFDPRTTALVLIDLQSGILALPTAPKPSSQVLEGGKSLASRFRAAGAAVVLVRVAFAPDYADAPPGAVDQPLGGSNGGLPADWARLAEGLEAPGDIVITKRQWGAFTGTELDLQLHRRGIRTIVLGGIATNFGVESTARHAWELGYNVVIAEDLCTSLSAELHDVAIRSIFPRIARVLDSDAIAFDC
ncbi:hydrolase [Acidomonas methanolica]|uniref:hydrolase n=1 Tax=Acidomonas methanolica TaxID=437 RepID=UPI001C0550C4|nr:hydrolase [Acidomonas methanolica]MBU2654919.1 hydrolase [Acidomonas methanolica]